MPKASRLLPLALLALSLTGCLAHVPVHSRGHMKIHWRADFEAARADALRLGQPILTVMIAGEKDGPTCFGGDVLRSAALNDDRVIEMINARFVPVWINVRTSAVPPFPFLDQVLVTGKVDADRRVIDRFSRTFFFRSVISSADGQILLNPGAPTVAKTAQKIVFEGDSSYEVNTPEDYLTMMRHALAREEDRRLASAR